MRCPYNHTVAQQIHQGIKDRILSGHIHDIGAFLCNTLGHPLDPYTDQHQINVADLSVAIGSYLGLDSHTLTGLRLSATMHDIGKFALSVHLLDTKDTLSDDEIARMQGHAEMGYEVLKDIELPWPVADIVLQHHERLDGSGYPRGLHESDILLEARIIGVADTVEAMACRRPYKKPKGLKAALRVIKAGRGSLFDQSVVDACIDLFRHRHYAFPGTQATFKTRLQNE